MIRKRSDVQGTAAPARPSPSPGKPAEEILADMDQKPATTQSVAAPVLPVSAKGSDVSVEGDEVTVCYGVDKYSPVKYNTFDHGPFFVKTKVRAGETVGDAAARAWNSCLAIAKGSYPGKAQEYLDNLRKLGISIVQ